MITVTDRAATQLEELRMQSNARSDQGVKLAPTGSNSIGMSIGTAGTGDAVIQQDDHPLLIVDSRIADSLDGSEIDCDPATNDGQAPQFKLQPRA